MRSALLQITVDLVVSHVRAVVRNNALRLAGTDPELAVCSQQSEQTRMVVTLVVFEQFGRERPIPAFLFRHVLPQSAVELPARPILRCLACTIAHST